MYQYKIQNIYINIQVNLQWKVAVKDLKIMSRFFFLFPFLLLVLKLCFRLQDVVFLAFETYNDSFSSVMNYVRFCHDFTTNLNNNETSWISDGNINRHYCSWSKYFSHWIRHLKSKYSHKCMQLSILYLVEICIRCCTNMGRNRLYRWI